MLSPLHCKRKRAARIFRKELNGFRIGVGSGSGERGGGQAPRDRTEGGFGRRHGPR